MQISPLLNFGKHVLIGHFFVFFGVLKSGELDIAMLWN